MKTDCTDTSGLGHEKHGKGRNGSDRCLRYNVRGSMWLILISACSHLLTCFGFPACANGSGINNSYVDLCLSPKKGDLWQQSVREPSLQPLCCIGNEEGFSLWCLHSSRMRQWKGNCCGWEETSTSAYCLFYIKLCCMPMLWTKTEVLNSWHLNSFSWGM